jgi:hypothetical protein
MSTLLLNVTVMFSNMENSDMVGNMLAIIFSLLALLFILPAGEITLASTIVTGHVIYVLLVSFMLWVLNEYDSALPPAVMFAANVVVTGVTAVWVLKSRRAFEALRDGIKEEFSTEHPLVAPYGPIDRKI